MSMTFEEKEVALNNAKKSREAKAKTLKLYL